MRKVGQQIERLQDLVNVIVLGCGRCQAMDRLGSDFKSPVLWPEAEDCIGVLLGKQRYEEELQRVPGTWFLSPGWTHMGTDFVFHELQLNRIGHQEIDPLQFARRMLEGLNRALYIEMQVDDDPETLHLKAQQIAMDLGLRLEKTTGSFALLEEVIRQALDICKDSG